MSLEALSQTQQRFAELVAATQLFLSASYPKGTLLLSSADCYDFFVREAKRGLGKAKSTASLEGKTSPGYRFHSAPPEAPAIDLPPQETCDPLPAVKTPFVPVAKEKSASSQVLTSPPRKETPSRSAKKNVTLIPLPPMGVELFAELRPLWQSMNPPLPWLDSPLDDTSARARKRKADILLLTSGRESAEEKAFLQAMAKGLQERWASTLIVTLESLGGADGWRSFALAAGVQLVLVTLSAKTQDPSLSRQDEEKSAASFHCLLLASTSDYEGHPSLKRALWQQIQCLVKRRPTSA